MPWLFVFDEAVELNGKRIRNESTISVHRNQEGKVVYIRDLQPRQFLVCAVGQTGGPCEGLDRFEIVASENPLRPAKTDFIKLFSSVREMIF